MIEKILHLLKENIIDTYLINTDTEQSHELFFIKKNLDMKRMKNVSKCELTVFNDFEKDNIKMRGSAVCQIYPDMSYDEIDAKIKDAYYAASFAANPYYPLPQPGEIIDFKPSDFTTEDAIRIMTEALFADDNSSECFINSAELFVSEHTHRIISSEGVDASYSYHIIEGEFVAQCITPNDVETYSDFYYETPDASSLRDKVTSTLNITRDRSNASQIKDTGKIKVILSGQYVADLLGFYRERSSASMIYPKYSDFKLNEQVQNDDIHGDELNISLNAKYPYSSEGVSMKNLPLLENRVLKNIHGSSRFCHYLNVAPTGIYTDIKVEPGTMSIKDMKKEKYLHIVNFSDFQMDSLSGRFGGEFRLAYYFDGEKTQPVTGGSVSGSILELSDNIHLSSETQKIKGFEGPLALSIDNVSF